MQAHSLYFPHLHGNDLKQISCSLSTIISQSMWGDSECSEKSEVERPGELTVPLSSLWKLPVFLWATLMHKSVGITSLVSLTEHLPKIGVFWYFDMCSCIRRSMCVLSHFSRVLLFVTLRTVAPPGSSVHGILQVRILEWVVCPSPGDLPDPGIEPPFPVSPALAGGFFTTSTRILDAY